MLIVPQESSFWRGLGAWISDSPKVVQKNKTKNTVGDFQLSLYTPATLEGY